MKRDHRTYDAAAPIGPRRSSPVRTQTQRAQPRVHYPVDVRLHAPATRETVRGRSLNVSPSGIFIEASAGFDVGTPIVCEMPLLGGVRLLKGHVARMQPLPLSAAGLGIGIKWSELDENDATLLAEMMRQSGQRSRLVRVRFEGMREAVPGQAMITDDGIRLSTALPFLRVGSDVGISFISGSSRIDSKGRVREVQMEARAVDGIPRLAVDVELHGRSESLPETPARIATPVETEDHRHDNRRILRAVPDAAEPARARSAPRRRLKVRGRRATTFPPMAPTGPAGMVEMDAVTVPPAPPRTASGEFEARAAATAAPPPRRALGVGLVALALLVAVGTGALAARIVARRPAAARVASAAATAAPVPRPALLPLVVPAPAAPAAEPVPAPAAALAPAIAAPSAPVTPVPTPAPARLVAPRPLPEGTPGPDIILENDRATAVVPVEGSTAGMIHYSLSHPRGLVVNLPHARSTLPAGLHTVKHDGFRFIWIREPAEGGLQVRFIFSHPTPDERVLDVEQQAVKVRIALPEQ